MDALKLNIGSRTRAEGWKTFDIKPGPEVDFVGNCSDLFRFADDTVESIYASHVLEHLSYQGQVLAALKEWNRVLVPGGEVMISVPDLDTLCRLFIHPQVPIQDRFEIMRVMFGGQMNEHDYHFTGFNWNILQSYMAKAGFRNITRVKVHGLFNDYSGTTFAGLLISLNVKARK